MAEQELHEQLERKIPVAPLGLIVISSSCRPHRNSEQLLIAG